MRGPRAGHVGRLTKRPDFVAAATGRRFHTERMTVQGRLRGEDGKGLRVGLTVTRKVGHATERNRIKRRLRSAVQSAAEAVPPGTDTDVVVIGRRDILGADYDLLIDDLRRALRVVTKPKSPDLKGGRPSGPRPAGGARATRKPEDMPPSPTGGERRGTSHA
jgi:ribonuclease P protein component